MAADKDVVAGACYWGCEREFHRLCLEADQRPLKRQWSEILKYMEDNPEEAKKAAVATDGELKLTPLAIVCQEAPLNIVEAMIDLAPEAAQIPDSYGDLPIHRVALQNRKDYAPETIQLLLDKAADSDKMLTKKDGWSRTPLLCALESGRGVAPPAVVCKLLGDKGQSVRIGNSNDKMPLQVITERKDKVTDEQRQAIIDVLQPFSKRKCCFCFTC